MKAICRYATGNPSDEKEGAIVEIVDLFVTRVTRDGKDLDLSDPEKWGYLRPQEQIQQMIAAGDYIEENFCHGVYIVIDES